jgi:hypothetical protein
MTGPGRAHPIKCRDAHPEASFLAVTNSEADLAYEALTAADLVPDETLDRIAAGRITADLDLLNHRIVAKRVAELVGTSKGKLNIALFGPWGSGKSSFYGLLREELQTLDADIAPIAFDAWKNAGPSFHTNFLSEIARQIKGVDAEIANRLFQTSRTVNLPFHGTAKKLTGRRVLVVTALLILALFVAIPFIWTVLLNVLNTEGVDFWPDLAANVAGWAGFAASGSLLFVVIAAILELSKVTIEEGTPGHVSQFSQLFDEALTKGRTQRFVIFVDELDRCSPTDVMQTLEGLRTFLGHDRCTFVVAFDREAISSTIAKHLRNEVPTRSAAPYYQTSGEYLDKIFQFQVSLPPQRVHTFRRYALSLVESRGGVWRQLRETSDRALERVVSILSPIHITSPRRTKVLLNDFAVNARVFQSLGFSWETRAEEIAALTVIQTEFPHLAADLEREPELLRYLANGDLPERPALMELHSRYRPDSVIEAIPAEIPDEETLAEEASPAHELDAVVARGPSAGATRRRVNDGLHVNLDRYLRKLSDMRCELPRADLILMHAEDALVRFDDPSAYNAVLAAADAPRDETVDILSSASELDQLGAVRYIAEEIEGETLDAAETLISVAGGIGAAFTRMPLDAAPHLMGLWERLAGDAAAIARLNPSSVRGFARAFAGTYPRADLESFIADLQTAATNSLHPSVGALIEELPADHWADAAETLAQATFRGEISGPLAASYLRRADREALGVPGSDLTQTFTDIMVHPEPPTVEPASGTTAARTAAAEQNAELGEAHNAAVAANEALMREIIAPWEELSIQGAIRRWLLHSLRIIGESNDWAQELHDEILQRDIQRGLTETVNIDLLSAIAEQPRHAATRWIGLLDPAVKCDGPVTNAALRSVMSRGIRSSDPLTMSNSVKNARAIVGCSPSNFAESAGDALALVSAAVRDGDQPMTEDRFVMLRGHLSALAPVADASEISAANASLIVRSLAELDEDVEASPALEAAQIEDVPTLEVVFAELKQRIPWSEDGALTRTTGLLIAQSRTRQSGVVSNALSWAEIEGASPAGVDADMFAMWLATGPAPAEVFEASETHALTSVPASAWKAYGNVTSRADRAAVWKRLRTLDATRPSLTAVAAEGIPSALYEEVAASINTGATAEQRGRAAALYRTLPSGRDKAKAALPILRALSASARKNDAATAVSVLLDVEADLTRAERFALKRDLGEWIGSSHAQLTKRNLRSLEAAGLIDGRKGIFAKIFGQ